MSGFADQIKRLERAKFCLEKAQLAVDDAKAEFIKVALQFDEALLLQREYPKLMTTSDRLQAHIEHAAMLERIVRDTYPT